MRDPLRIAEKAADPDTPLNIEIFSMSDNDGVEEVYFVAINDRQGTTLDMRCETDLPGIARVLLGLHEARKRPKPQAAENPIAWTDEPMPIHAARKRRDRMLADGAEPK